MSYADTEIKVIQWAEARKIIPNSTPQSQLMKTVEEVGELVAAESRNQQANIVDAVGDVVVTIIIYCALRDIDLTACLESAYAEIKDRKGVLMANGIFVREE